MAEVRPRLRLTGLGPEEEGKPLARLRGVAVQQQLREQRLGAAGVEGRHLRFAEAKIQATKQPYAERRRSAHRCASLRALLAAAVDFDRDGRLVGIEAQAASRFVDPGLLAVAAP